MGIQALQQRDAVVYQTITSTVLSCTKLLSFTIGLYFKDLSNTSIFKFNVVDLTSTLLIATGMLLIHDGIANFSRICTEAKVYILGITLLTAILTLVAFQAFDAPFESQYYAFSFFLLGCLFAAAFGEGLNQTLRERDRAEARSVILCL